MFEFHSIFNTSTRARGAHVATVAALLGAACLIAPIGAAAQATSVHHHRSAAEAWETLEARIATLHSQLDITPGEEGKWNAVAQVMRSNEADMQKMVAERRGAAPGGGTAVDELKTYERFTQAHVDGLKNLISSFESLYAAMPARQQALADHVFQHFGHRNGVSRT
jgi:hypothetical protein